jgi:hypothetical protein
MRRTERSGIFQNGPFPPLPVGSMREFLSNIRCENLVEFLEAKLTRCDSPLPTTLITWSLWSLYHSGLSILSLAYAHQLQFWFFSTSALASALVNSHFLCFLSVSPVLWAWVFM